MSQRKAGAEVLTLEEVAQRLKERYGEAGQAAAQRLGEWLSGRIPEAYPDTIAKLLRPDCLELLYDAFRTRLAFGTAGARGRVGYGPNRFNTTTVITTVQGHCDYLRARFPGKDLCVVVANDVRRFNDLSGVYTFLGEDHPLLGASSRSLAERACEVYAANGITAYFADPGSPDAIVSTPMLSFLISHLQAHGGVNLSASHNPPDDNGIKVYDENGGQLVPPYDHDLSVMVEQAQQVNSLGFEEARAAGRIVPIPPEAGQAYLAAYRPGLTPPAGPVQGAFPVVYTPLCGCGLTTAGEILKLLGLPFRVPPHQGPDGTFEAIPLRAPNPEVIISATPSLQFADEQGLGLVLSSDPDADRVGVEAKLPDGSWHHFDGNQIAATICYYLMLDPQGPQRRGLVLETLVTTRLLGAIVAEAGKSGECWIVDDLLVGFKYIANVLHSLEQTGRFGKVVCTPEQFILAAEESHGLGTLPAVRDKDAAPACAHIATLYQRLQAAGDNLVDYYARILQQLGHYDSLSYSVVMTGAEGLEAIRGIMSSLRQTPPTTLGGEAVTRVADRWDEQAYGPFVSDTDRNARDIVQYHTRDYIFTVRPSGTEPKLKVYCQLLPSGEQSHLQGQALLAQLRELTQTGSREVCKHLLERVGIELGEAGLRIIDVVAIDRKTDFETRLAPLLHDRLQKDAGTPDELLQWLREETKAMTPGTDPLPAVKPAVAYLLRQWTDVADGRLYAALKEWAGAAG